MTGLLDTHVFLWSINDPSRISPNASAFLRDPKNQLLLSVASVWEIAIKVRSGKLITAWPVTAIPTLLMASRIDLLDIRVNHALMAGSFPHAHKDPFDRMLAAQSLIEGAMLVTADSVMTQYGVPIIW